MRAGAFTRGILITTERTEAYIINLVRELCKQPQEAEWVEFKHNNADPQDIGEYISALSNSAALAGKASAYMVWGMSDREHAIIGTDFSPKVTKKGNEELENWLLRALSPRIHFRFFEVRIDERSVVLLEIKRASIQPVQFQGNEFIRVGTYKKRLKDFPEKERALWRLFDRAPFESGIAAGRVMDDEVLKFLDYPAYFDLLKIPLPESRTGILEALANDSLISPCEAGGWDITNLGAILLARRIDSFSALRRKPIRVIQYRGNNRIETIKEYIPGKGYASGFEGLIEYINGLLPSNELIGQALRKEVPMFPELAVRELVANALIHQDFSITGASPMVEIFADRIEITNPGAPLVDTNRFVDTPPRSRNEALAALMRRFGICEERGSGWDKVVFQTEFYQLPAPLPEATSDHTRVVLFSHRPQAKMDKADRIRAVYLHSCLRYVNRENMTNTSIRERFGIAPKNIAAASRLIREAVDAGYIFPYDPNAAPKLMRYVPFWANPTRDTNT